MRDNGPIRLLVACGMSPEGDENGEVRRGVTLAAVATADRGETREIARP